MTDLISGKDFGQLSNEFGSEVAKICFARNEIPERVEFFEDQGTLHRFISDNTYVLITNGDPVWEDDLPGDVRGWISAQSRPDKRKNLVGSKEARLLADNLEAFEIGESVLILDSQQKGTTIVRTGRDSFVCISLESSGNITKCNRLILVEGAQGVDPDETGLNQSCIACDFDTQYRLWVINADGIDDSFIPPIGYEFRGGVLIWDSCRGT